jgi:hypothetical protein
MSRTHTRLICAEIEAERRRQIDQEGWNARHDDEHPPGSLATAAACYAAHAGAYEKLKETVNLATYVFVDVPSRWPWSHRWWKPKNPRHDLIKAGALIVAEIERLDRDTAR